MTDEAELTWEIDRWGDLLVTKTDDTGSSMLRLGPINDVLATLASFLRAAELASGTPTRRAETTGSVAEGDGGPTAESGDAPNPDPIQYKGEM